MIDFPPMRAGSLLKVSATSYTAFLRCPAQVQARYDEKAYPAETKESFRGALVHRLIARHLRSGPFEDVALVARSEIGQGLNEKMVALGINRPSLLDPIISEAEDSYRRFARFPIDGFEEAEITVDHLLGEDVLLIGKIDGVFKDGNARVLRDWKTGALGEPHHQLLFYALVWFLTKGDHAWVEAISLQTGERTRNQPTLSDLQGVANRVAEMVNSVRSVRERESLSLKVAGPWCDRCPILLGCAEGLEASHMVRSRHGTP